MREQNASAKFRGGRGHRKVPFGEHPPRRKPGPAPWQPTKSQVRMIENLKILGMGERAIANYLGIHLDTLKKNCQWLLDNAVMKAGAGAIENLQNIGKTKDTPNYHFLHNRFPEHWRDTRHVQLDVKIERPDLSRATEEELELLDQAAQVYKRLAQPAQVIDGTTEVVDAEQTEETDER